MDILFFILTLPIAIPMNFFLRNHDDFLRNLPYKPRFMHWMITAWGGFYWLPCTLCNKNRGGHEQSGFLSTSYGGGVSVCRNCAAKANGINKKNNYFIPEVIDVYPFSERTENEKQDLSY